MAREFVKGMAPKGYKADNDLYIVDSQYNQRLIEWAKENGLIVQEASR